jgi:hypothetical protein
LRKLRRLKSLYFGKKKKDGKGKGGDEGENRKRAKSEPPKTPTKNMI